MRWFRCCCFSLVVALSLAAPARAAFHLYQIAEMFTSADGTVQFVRLHCTSASQNLWGGLTITCTNGGTTHTLTFAGNLPSSATANTDVLIATSNFGAISGITPNYIIPANFLFLNSGSLNFANAHTVNYTALPTDGQHSLTAAGVQVINAPRNFAGTSGSVNVPPGRCCVGAACSVTVQVSCTGTWSVGAACGAGSCAATGQCCNGASCTVTAQAACAGTWTLGASCPVGSCAPTGQCCVTTNCSVTVQAGCPGTWTLGGACPAGSCAPPPTGACCNNTTCSTTTAAACSGSFQGTSVACGVTGNPTTCCRANYNRVDGVTLADVFDFLNGWFASCLGQAGAPCNGLSADFNGGGLDIQDVFDFLNAWFAGC